MTKPVFSLVTAALTMVGMIATTPAFGEREEYPFGFGLTFGARQSDNADHIPDGGSTISGRPISKRNDTQFRVYPTFSFEYNFDNTVRLQLYYHPTYIWNTNPREGGTKSEFTHGADALLRFQASPRTTLLFTDNLTWSGDKSWYYGDVFTDTPAERSVRDDKHYVNRAHLELSRNMSARLNGNVYGTYQIKRFDNTRLANHYDEDVYVIGVGITKIRNTHLSYGLYARYTRFDRSTHGKIEDRNGIIDNGVQYIDAGFRITYDIRGDKHLVLNATSGYNYMWYEAEINEDGGKFGDVTLSLSINQTERTGGAIGFRYGRNYSEIFPYSSQDDFSIFGSIFTRVDKSGDLKLSASFEYRKRSYDLITVDPDSYDAASWESWIVENAYQASGDRISIYLRLGADYKLTKSISFGAFYSYENVESDVDTDYTENVFGASVTVTFL